MSDCRFGVSPVNYPDPERFNEQLCGQSCRRGCALVHASKIIYRADKIKMWLPRVRELINTLTAFEMTFHLVEIMILKDADRISIQTKVSYLP